MAFLVSIRKSAGRGLGKVQTLLCYSFYFGNVTHSIPYARLFRISISLVLFLSLITYYTKYNNIRPDCRWAYPIVARVFYDSLSHSVVVPLSVMLTTYFDSTLPSYLHYATVGVSIGKEILRSITRSFDKKVMRCVPSSVNIYSNASRMDLLLQSGGTQIAYHSLLSLTGPIKGMLRLPNINMLPTQIFYLVRVKKMKPFNRAFY